MSAERQALVAELVALGKLAKSWGLTVAEEKRLDEIRRTLWPDRPKKGTVGRPRLQERQRTSDRYDTVAGPTIGAVNVFVRITSTVTATIDTGS